MYTEGDDYQVKEAATPSITNSSMLTNFVDPQLHHQQVPKLEDFLGGDSSSLVRYSESQTETQDSSLTHIYDHGSAYFNEQQDLKAIAATAGFQAFSTNSGSEVEDSSSIGRTQLASSDFPGHSIESGNELAFSHCPTGALSLGVTTTTTTTQRSDQQAIVSADSDCSKKIADTFGQRTSIYRGVTRYGYRFFLSGLHLALVQSFPLLAPLYSIFESQKWIMGFWIKIWAIFMVLSFVDCLSHEKGVTVEGIGEFSG